MKLVKMSLVAAMVMGASAFAVDNVKVSGDAKLFYNTNNADYTKDGVTQSGLFDQGVAGQGGAAADTALRLGVTGDLLKGVSFGLTANAVSTLGLENNLVSNTWNSAHKHAGAQGVNDAMWISEAWLATTMGKTTAKIGRMELDTPLAFSEKWSVAANTFDAAVLINQDLPDTTLVGAWVGKGNGVNALAPLSTAKDNRNAVNALGIDGIMAANAGFSTYGSKGAYAVAAVNNSFKPLTAQAWYYNVVDIADAYWLQADIACSLVKDLKIGLQYANMNPKGSVDAVTVANGAGNAKDSSAYAAKLAYEGVKNLKVSVAYSDVDADGVLNISNTATNNLLAAQSKLYTEAFWNYGYVGAPGATSWNATAEYDAGFAKLGAYYTDVTIDNNNNAVVGVLNTLSLSRANGTDMTEIALSASKSFGPLDATLAYISTDADDQNKDAAGNGQRYDSVQAYLTLNF
ncbi:MAG: OprD family outer membrane porin [Sulfuricurvum sp.]|nr:OprD family outer membrane porin [Sulfuricurvum sp.]